MNISEWPSQPYAFVGATLFFLIAKSKDIFIVIKDESERSEEEAIKIKQGLLKSLLLEVFVFVPASTLLMLLIAPLVIQTQLSQMDVSKKIASYTLVGVLSYGFPFSTIRSIVQQMAFAILKEYGQIMQKNIQKDLPEKSERSLE